MKILRDALSGDAFLLDLDAESLSEVFRKTLDHLVSRDLLPAENRTAVEEALRERENVASTAIGHSVSVPHAYLDCLDRPAIVFVRLSHPLNLGAPDGIPTRFFFILLGPQGHAAEHLDTLMQIARLMSDDEFRFDARRAHSRQDLRDGLERFLKRTTSIEAVTKRKPVEGLKWTGVPFGGIWNDIKRRLPHYKSDFVDGLNLKCASAVLFLFFACLAPAITFGGIMGAITEGHIGVVEMLVATAICGAIYALTSGQPLMILGGVGPLLVFTGILYELCVDWNLPFLPTYYWIGLWTALILVVLAASDASFLMRYFTRFTDEIFAALMSLIFIYEASRAIFLIFGKSFESGNNHDKAFLSLILALGTFFVAIYLSQFRKSKYLLPQMREFLADFGPTIAIAAMTCVAIFFQGQVELDRLQAPETIRPSLIVNEETGESRAWLVDGFAAPNWVIFAAILPAIVAAILVFLVQNITARLINSPDMKLKKGEAYHLDLGLVGLMIGFCSLFGLPWLAAASVRSIAHVRGVSVLEEVIEGNQTREQIIHVFENRVTALSIHLLIGFSLLLLGYFTVTPMAVLFGLFLYMGVISISGNQFFERLNLWLMDSSLYPKTHYIRLVPYRVVHAFTFIQLTALIVLSAINLSSVDALRISFPIFIALLAPLRYLLGHFFSPEHMALLDADTDPSEEETHWAG